MSVTGEVTEGPAVCAHLKVLLEKVTSRELLNVATVAQVREMKECEMQLQKIRSTLERTEKTEIQEASALEWLEDLTYLAYDVEDILDEFSTECLRGKVNKRERHAAKTCHMPKLISACFSKQKSEIDQQKSEIAEITTKLKDTADNIPVLTTRRLPESTSFSRLTSSIPPEYINVRDSEKAEILDFLCRDDDGDDKVAVFLIFGPSGMGKTTLARSAYNDNRVLDRFQVRAWVRVSANSDMIRVSQEILEQITFQNSDWKDLNLVQLQLNQALAGKKFLIVLDDVSSFRNTDWGTLLIPLLDGAPGSKIIVTSRYENIADEAGAKRLKLMPLTGEASWKLFTAYAFESTSIPKGLEDAAATIFYHCEGLPLALKAAGLLLRGQTEEMWNEVRRNRAWDSRWDSHIIPALKLSYYYLPSILKRCFLYCSIFPKDYDFEKKQIILLWKAEGLIPLSDDGSNVEEQGTKIFDQLVSRSFFQVFAPDQTRFTMNLSMYELAQRTAGDICAKFEDENDAGEKSSRARYSSYTQGDLDGFKSLAFLHKIQRLRTFLPFSRRRYHVCYLASCFPNKLVESNRYLRVLSFSRCNIKELPSSIGDLKHLRYLDLSYTQIEVLPDSITSLYNLQTLILEECENLRNLPARMDKLINLFHLNIRGVHLIEGMPYEIEQLRGLQMLSNFVVGKGSFSVATLKSLKSLRGEICISNLDYVKNASDASDAELMENTCMHNLELTWNTGSYVQDGETQYEVLNKLQPHSNLKKLIVSDYTGTKLPSWVQGLTNLVDLKLEGCESCTSLPQLGTLPILEKLCIIRMSNLQKIDQQFYGSDCSNPFPSLKVLCFRFMDDWKMWDDCRFEFKKLSELYVGNCGKLSGNLPTNLPLLKVLVVNDCENLVASLSNLTELSALEIRNCKEVVFKPNEDFSSLNTIVLSNISTIQYLAGLAQRVKKFKNLTLSCESNFTMTVPSSLRQYGGVVTNLECVFQKLPSTNLEQLQKELERSEIEVVTLREFKTLPAWLQKLKFLRELITEGCQVTCPGDLPSMLKVLSVIDCDVFAAFSDLIVRNSESLQELELCGCDFLISFGRGQLPPTLKKLSIVDCKNLKSLFEEDECGSSSFSTELEDMFISGCDNLTSISSIPEGKLLSKLQRLEISNCKKLESIVDRFDLHIPLKFMYICDCGGLKSLPEGLHNLFELHDFEIFGCQNIVSFPKEGLPTGLKRLEIRDLERLEALPDSLHKLSSLQELHISNCTSLVLFSGQGLPPELSTFSLKNVRMFEWGLDKFSSLQKLDIEKGCAEVALFPPDNKLPRYLTHLAIRDFPNLERFSSEFQYLSLKSLTLCNCPKLASFPVNGQLDDLLELDIRNCLMLEKLWQEGGQEQLWWSKICNIPKFEISDT